MASTLVTAVAELRQRKLYTDDQPDPPAQFAVQEQVLSATPEKLLNPFVLEVYSGSNPERLYKVATLTELNDDSTYPINPLEYFRDLSVSLAAAQAGDVLEIDAPPSEWNTGVYTDPQQFTVAALVSGRLQFAEPFWSTMSGLTWTLKRGVATVASGTEGQTERETVLGLGQRFKTDRFVAKYDLPNDALDHIRAVQINFKLLVDAVGIDPQSYLDYDPGNPIDTSYSS